MIDKMFYPTFTLSITILACFLRKKKTKLLRHLHSCIFQGIALDPLGDLKPPRPQLQSFSALPRTDAPYFFCIIPWKYIKTGFILLAVFNRSTVRRQFTFNHWVSRNSWSLFDWPQNDMRRLSRPWSHPVVLNPGLDCKFSTLTINKKQNKILSKY